MLGRLFRSSSSSPLQDSDLRINQYPSLGNLSLHDALVSPSALPGPPTSAAAYEDAYTRTLLYGTKLPLKNLPGISTTKLFRLVVCQDMGGLRKKQVMCDSAATPARKEESHPLTRPLCSVRQSPSPPLTSKIHHPVRELMDYMFGCGLPIHENSDVTKFHVFPRASLHRDASPPSHVCVLITRIFTLAGTNTAVEDFLERQRIRVSIGLVVPLDAFADINKTLAINWEEIVASMDDLQSCVSAKLIAVLLANPTDLAAPLSSPSTVNRLQFPLYSLQYDQDINFQFAKFVKMVQILANTCRLLTGHYTPAAFGAVSTPSNVQSSMTSPHFSHLKKAWCSELINWLEFKDGRTSVNNVMVPRANQTYGSYSSHGSFSSHVSPPEKAVTFLAALFSAIIPLRHQLLHKPCNIFDTQSKKKVIVRVVIMANNSIIAKKLMFLIGRLVPENVALIADRTIHPEPELSGTGSPLSPAPQTKARSPVHKVSRSSAMTPCLEENTEPMSSSPASSSASAKGWQVPKSAAVPIKSTASSNLHTHSIEVIQPSVLRDAHTASPTAASSTLAYLSSSLSSSYSSSWNQFSWNTKHGSQGMSFLEKWKANANAGTNHSGVSGEFYRNQNVSNLSINLSTLQGDNYVLASPSSIIKKRNQIAKTPSPGLEYDDYFWSDDSHKLSPLSGTASVNASVPSSIPASVGSIPGSLAGLHLRASGQSASISRVSSYFDLSMTPGHTPQPDSFSSTPTVLGSRNHIPCVPEVERSKTTISHMGSNIAEKHSLQNAAYETRPRQASLVQGLRKRCRFIMLSDPVIEDGGLEEVSLLNVVGCRNSHFDLQAFNQTNEYSREFPLLPIGGYLDEFRPEFIMQACPISTSMEQQISKEVVRDVKLHQATLDYEEVISRTICVSLRAREIKEISCRAYPEIPNFPVEPLMRSEDDRTVGSDKPGCSKLSYSLDHQDSLVSRSPLTFVEKPKVKRLYTPLRPSANQNYIDKIDSIFCQLNSKYKEMMRYEQAHQSRPQTPGTSANVAMSVSMGMKPCSDEMAGEGEVLRDIDKLIEMLLDDSLAD
ncbi:hypothetical protein BABINDRAFT_167189 [Babjeviella inositovora NRRL Y-12698]|uniref:LST4 longin domain-containing protein n=1 Tax=Babjeviella inositovora NRRL Y-12698 TaxID=984486 RepID=A0A1E3QNV2_9ASCO|nr:uncharacterized protein BABINDRAFT_167189 [Babjeviella inositovora NRRL Y-12698]ODQ79318.1 hypothetical protein BABINDRAFT_167189 [Babjeviella inositovora NRRL Y-12698]